jgi:hypothetical protein
VLRLPLDSLCHGRDRVCHVRHRLIAIRAKSDGNAVARNSREVAKGRRPPPQTVPKNNWNDGGFTLVMTLHGTRHFPINAVIRVQKVWTDQEQYDVGPVKFGVYFVGEFLASFYSTVVPLFY